MTEIVCGVCGMTVGTNGGVVNRHGIIGHPDHPRGVCPGSRRDVSGS